MIADSNQRHCKRHHQQHLLAYHHQTPHMLRQTALLQGKSLVGGKVATLQTAESHIVSVASSTQAALYLAKHTLASLMVGTQVEQKESTLETGPSEAPHSAAATSRSSRRAAWRWFVEAVLATNGSKHTQQGVERSSVRV